MNKSTKANFELLKSVCSELDCVEEVQYKTCSERFYSLNVLSIFNPKSDLDRIDDDKYQYFVVIYKPDCYAMPRTISTYEFNSWIESSKKYLVSLKEEINPY